MFRARLHPTPSGIAFGFLVIALWALLWIWFLFQLGDQGPQQARSRLAAVASSTPLGVRGLV